MTYSSAETRLDLVVRESCFDDDNMTKGRRSVRITQRKYILFYSTRLMFRHLTGFLPKHGRISEGALEMSSSASLREKNLSVSYESCVLHSRVYLF